MSESTPSTPPSKRARALLVFGRALVAYIAVLTTGYWVEAEKEARVLCRLSNTGTPADEVDRLFGTANLLRVEREGSGDQQTLHVRSPHNLWLSGCTVTIAGGTVASMSFVEHARSGAWAPYVLLVGLSWLVVFHLRSARSAFSGTTDPSAPQLFRHRWLHVTSDLVSGVLVLLGIGSLLDFTQLVAVPFLTPLSGAVGGLLVLAFLAEFAIAPGRSTPPARRVAQRVFPLIMACSGVVVLLGG